MICGNCGERLEPSARFCGKCGAVVTMTPELNADDSAAGMIDSIENKKADKKNTIVGISFVVVICLIGVLIFGRSFGVNASVKSYMKAFEAKDSEAMYSMASDYTKQYFCAYFTKYPSYTDVTYYFGNDFTQEEVIKYVDGLYSEEFKKSAEDFFDDFDRRLGSDYKISYKITETESVDSETLSEFNKEVHEVTKTVTYTGMKLVEVEVTGKSKDETYSKTMTLILSHEGMKWKVLFADKLF